MGADPAQISDLVDYIAKPVDATTVAATLSTSSDARLIVNAFHHLSPDSAESVLRDAITSDVPMMVVEPLAETPSILALLSGRFTGALGQSFDHVQRRWQQALLFHGSPGLAAALWDGTVSTLRMYTEMELREMRRYSNTYIRGPGLGTLILLMARGLFFFGAP